MTVLPISLMKKNPNTFQKQKKRGKSAKETYAIDYFYQVVIRNKTRFIYMIYIRASLQPHKNEYFRS